VVHLSKDTKVDSIVWYRFEPYYYYNNLFSRSNLVIKICKSGKNMELAFKKFIIDCTC
jgi:hypothetical protein